MSPIAETVNKSELKIKFAADLVKLSRHELNNNEHGVRTEGDNYFNSFHGTGSQQQMVIISQLRVFVLECKQQS